MKHVKVNINIHKALKTRAFKHDSTIEKEIFDILVHKLKEDGDLIESS